jgi:hypothetical protein
MKEQRGEERLRRLQMKLYFRNQHVIASATNAVNPVPFLPN